MTRVTASPGPYALSPGQLGLWLHERLGRTQLTTTTSLELHGRLDVSSLVGALHRVHHAHPMLRTRFGHDRGAPAQTPDVQHHLDVEVFDGPDDGRPSEQAEVFLRRHLDLAEGECQRASITRCGDYHHRLDVVTHHLVCDAQSWSSVLLPQLAAHYNHLCGAGDPPPGPGRTYVEYLDWRRQMTSSRGYASRVEAIVTNLMSDVDLAGSHRPTVTATQPRAVQFLASSSISRWSEWCHRQMRVSTTAVLMAATHWALSSVSEREANFVGLRLTDRPDPSFDDVCGLFANVVPFSLPARDGSAVDAIGRAARPATVALTARHVALSDIEAAARRRSAVAGIPLVAMMTYTPQDESSPEMVGLHAAIREREPDMSFPLEISYYTVSGQLQGSVYGTGDATDNRIERVAEAIECFLTAARNHPDRPLPKLAEVDR